MNQKKCPKCGENNPVEAVMCWACYTPLSASATAGAGAIPGGPSTGATSRGGDGGRKGIAPWQIGLLAVALLAVGGSVFFSMAGSSTTPNYGGEGGTVQEFTGPPTSFPGPSNGGPSVAPPPLPGMPGRSSAPNPGPVANYTVTTSPNPNSSTGTVGIVPKQAVGAQQAAALATSTGKRYRGGPWRSIHVYVFADVQTARSFNSFQRNSGGKPLGSQDYQQLQNVWANTLARYENAGGREAVRYPQSRPNGWWQN